MAVEGWTESSQARAADVAARFAPANPACFIYTDIERDGMMQGPNIAATKEFAQGTPVPVILSGGVTTYDDIESALPLARDGVVGIIIGRALYEETIELKSALRMVASTNAG